MTFDSDEVGGAAGPVIRDKRRIDPKTGQVREPRETPAPGTRAAATPGSAATAAANATAQAEPAAAGLAAELAAAKEAVVERTADLQRLQAEYINYKRRVERDREATRQLAVSSTLAALLPVLDDIGRAREHDELTGGFKAVAESFERIVGSLGLESFGEPGDPFDPRIHEALMHAYSDQVEEPICQAVLQVGYRFGDKIVRPARVAVAEPTAALPEPDRDAARADFDAEAASAEDGRAADPEPAAEAEPDEGTSAADQPAYTSRRGSQRDEQRDEQGDDNGAGPGA